ncbi:hypothetical protein VTI28DRAFT_512 [Corynascus sepedonium]
MCFKGHTDYVFCASFSADGRYLASGGDDRSVRVWDLAPESNSGNDNDDQAPLSDGTTRHRLLCRNRSGRITGITFSPDNRQVISSSDDGTITIWDLLPTNEGQQPIKQHVNLKIGFTYLYYSGSHPDWILTEIGARLLMERTYEPPPVGWTRWSLSKERDWILCGGREKIFLPELYRPDMKTARVQGGTVVIGCRSGHVMVFRFEEDGEDVGGRGRIV